MFEEICNSYSERRSLNARSIHAESQLTISEKYDSEIRTLNVFNNSNIKY